VIEHLARSGRRETISLCNRDRADPEMRPRLGSSDTQQSHRHRSGRSGSQAVPCADSCGWVGYGRLDTMVTVRAAPRARRPCAPPGRTWAGRSEVRISTRARSDRNGHTPTAEPRAPPIKFPLAGQSRPKTGNGKSVPKYRPASILADRLNEETQFGTGIIRASATHRHSDRPAISPHDSRRPTVVFFGDSTISPLCRQNTRPPHG